MDRKAAIQLQETKYIQFNMAAGFEQFTLGPIHVQGQADAWTGGYIELQCRKVDQTAVGRALVDLNLNGIGR